MTPSSKHISDSPLLEATVSSKLAAGWPVQLLWAPCLSEMSSSTPGSVSQVSPERVVPLRGEHITCGPRAACVGHQPPPDLSQAQAALTLGPASPYLSRGTASPELLLHTPPHRRLGVFVSMFRTFLPQSQEGKGLGDEAFYQVCVAT